MTSATGIRRDRSELSALRTGGRRGGFTLLEIVVSLAIVTILGTLFVFRFAGNSAEEQLREPAEDLRRLARMANRQSAAFRDDYRITFFQDGFFLSREALTDRTLAIGGHVLPRDSGIRLEIRRFGSSRWTQPAGDEWLFQPAGLNEPVEVRFAQPPSFIELKFDPMTAAVQSERFLFP